MGTASAVIDVGPRMAEAPVLVVGAGAWGTALASVCARAGRPVLLYDKDAATLAALRATRHHPRFAEDLELHAAIEPLEDLAAAPPLTAPITVPSYRTLLPDKLTGPIDAKASASDAEKWDR